ncbi:MAG: DUF6020 family protein [Lachnospiraceae bacterium]|nr:DUF6020 family protein [Lachnospiraceae bacterium]
MRTKKVICASILSFGSVCALHWALKAGDEGLGFTNSIFAVFVFLGLAALFCQILQSSFAGSLKRWIVPGIFGFCFSLCMVMGACLDKWESIPFDNPGMWLAVLMLAVSACLTARYFWDKIWDKMTVSEERKRGFSKQEEKAVEGKRLLRGIGNKNLSWPAYSGIIFLLHLPTFLAVYPGFFVYDAQDELMQVITRNFTTHHPLVHVLLLGGIIQFIYKITGSYNLGIACYTLVQMLFMAGIFGWCIRKLREWGLKKGYGILLVLYFGLFPVLVMFSLCSAKDGLFAGMLLVMSTFLTKYFENPEVFWNEKRNVISLYASSLFMMLLRHNGFYAYLAAAFGWILFLIVKRDRRVYWKKLLVFLAGVLGSYLLIHHGMAVLLSADTSENQEMLTVPITQMARVHEMGKDDLPEEEKELLYRYLPEEALAHYTPKVSDGVKIYFDNQAYQEDKGSFWKLWLLWGTQNPFTYLNAWFMTSYGFWYPDTVIDVYRGNTVFTFTYGDSSYFGFEVEEPGMRESKFPRLLETYRKLSLEIYQQKLPVVSMMFSPGFLFWVWAFCLCFWVYRARMDKVMPYLPIVFCQLTVLLGPTYLVRYVVFLWAALPLLLAEFDNYRQL